MYGWNDTAAPGRDGLKIALRGRVRPAGTALEAPLSGSSCVYYEVGTLVGVPSEREAQSFMLDEIDGAERHGAATRSVFVRTQQHCQVSLSTASHADTLRVIDADLEALSQRLRQIKELMRQSGGQAQRALFDERRQLRDLVTYLCTMRAHARGRLHGNRTDLMHQARWLESRRARYADRELAEAMPSVQIERWEMLIEPGQVVSVAGLTRFEPDPDPRSAGAGYRERPMRCCVVGSADFPLMVSSDAAQLRRARARHEGGHEGEDRRGDDEDDGRGGRRDRGSRSDDRDAEATRRRNKVLWALAAAAALAAAVSSLLRL